MMRSDDARKLTAQIRAAFAGVAYPGDDNLVSDDKDYEARTEVAPHFRGKRVEDHFERPEALLGPEANDMIALLSPEAFVYYLPLYLAAVVIAYDKIDTVRSNVFVSFAPGPDGELSAFRKERVERLSLAQLRAVLATFEFMCRQYDYKDNETMEAAIRSVNRLIDEREK